MIRYPLYYWPKTRKRVEKTCLACSDIKITCLIGDKIETGEITVRKKNGHWYNSSSASLLYCLFLSLSFCGLCRSFGSCLCVVLTRGVHHSVTHTQERRQASRDVSAPPLSSVVSRGYRFQLWKLFSPLFPLRPRGRDHKPLGPFRKIYSTRVGGTFSLCERIETINPSSLRGAFWLPTPCLHLSANPPLCCRQRHKHILAEGKG